MSEAKFRRRRHTINRRSPVKLGLESYRRLREVSILFMTMGSVFTGGRIQ